MVSIPIVSIVCLVISLISLLAGQHLQGKQITALQKRVNSLEVDYHLLKIDMESQERRTKYLSDKLAEESVKSKVKNYEWGYTACKTVTYVTASSTLLSGGFIGIGGSVVAEMTLKGEKE